MGTRDTLLLHEEIALLALQEEKGTFALEAKYLYAIGAALLAELLLSNLIRVEETKKKLVNPISTTPIGEPVIDECLEKITSAKRRASLRDWVSRFARIKDLKHRVAAQLCSRGTLQATEDKVLFIFKRKLYSQINLQPRKNLVERLRLAIFTDTRDVEPRTVVLMSLMNSAGLLEMVFDKKGLKDRKVRIERIINGEATGPAAKEAIAAMQAAVMATVIMPTVTQITVTQTTSN